MMTHEEIENAVATAQALLYRAWADLNNTKPFADRKIVNGIKAAQVSLAEVLRLMDWTGQKPVGGLHILADGTPVRHDPHEGRTVK